jgi:hypothetical protein
MSENREAIRNWVVENCRYGRTESHELSEVDMLVDELLALAAPFSQWHVFDKDDESTHPQVAVGVFWTAFDDESVGYQHWFRDTGWEFASANVTHWMLMEVPEPP